MIRLRVSALASGLLLAACSTPRDILSPNAEIHSAQTPAPATSTVVLTRSVTLVELDTVQFVPGPSSLRDIRISDSRVATVTTREPYLIFPRAIGDVRLTSSGRSTLNSTILVRPAATSALAITSHPSGTASMKVGDSVFVRAAYVSAKFGVLSCVGLTLAASPSSAVAYIRSSGDGFWVKSATAAATAVLTARCVSTGATTPLALTVTGSNTSPTAPVFALTSLSATNGPVTGGDVLTLRGRSFAPGMNVMFGTVSSPSVTVPDDSTASVTVPASPAVGPVPVTAQQGTSTTIATLAATYLYVAAASDPNPPPPAPVGRLFSTGFDDGTYGGMYNWYISRGVVADSTANGGRSLQLDWLGNATGDQNQGVGWALPAGLKTVYVRFRYKVSANADLMGIKKTIRVRAAGYAPARAVGTLDIAYGAFIMFGDDLGAGINVWPTGYDTRLTPAQQPNSTVMQNNPGTFKNRWRYVEMMLDYADPTKQKMKLWVDGTLVTDYTCTLAVPLSSAFSLSDVWLGSVFNVPGAAMSEWYDDVVISTSRIGPL